MTNCKTEAEATLRGRRLLKLMKSKGWVLDVWHNLHWCYCLHSTRRLYATWTLPGVYPHEQPGRATTYMALINGIGAHPCSDYFADPNKAVAQLVERAEEWDRRRQRSWKRFLKHHELTSTTETSCQKKTSKKRKT